VGRLITDEGVAAGAFDSHAADGIMSVAHSVAGTLAFRRSIQRQEVTPMHAVSAAGASLHCTIARLS
jgi:hypothetical protein